MPCSPRSSTGCCTCHAQGRRAEQTLGSLPRPPPAPRATHSQESWGRGGLGASGHPTVTRTLYRDQVSSGFSLIMLLTCSRGVYGSLVLTGTKVNSAQCSKTLPYPVPASLAHGAPNHPCPSPQTALSTVPRALKFQVSSCPSSGSLSLGGEACKRGANPFLPRACFPTYKTRKGLSRGCGVCGPRATSGLPGSEH